ncbi:MAG: hypothetical protein M1493_05445 [Firmicutes bacterium]|nr:hypothetical protein [Bacillota bacterium]
MSLEIPARCMRVGHRIRFEMGREGICRLSALAQWTKTGRIRTTDVAGLPILRAWAFTNRYGQLIIMIFVQCLRSVSALVPDFSQSL